MGSDWPDTILNSRIYFSESSVIKTEIKSQCSVEINNKKNIKKK